MVVVDVDDLDTVLEQAGSVGGQTVVGRTPVGDRGFTASVRDPEGNVLGPWETVPG